MPLLVILRVQHFSVGEGALDIKARHALIEVDGSGIAFHQVGDRFGEARGPGLRLVGELVL